MMIGRREELELMKSSWEKDRFAQIESRMPRSMMDEVAAAFERFVTEVPREVRLEYQTFFHPGIKNSHVGYEEKRVAEGNKDNKDLFMFNHALERDLGHDKLYRTREPAIDDFFGTFREAFGIVTDMTREQCRRFDAGLEGTILADGSSYRPIEPRIFADPTNPEIYNRMVFYLDHGNHQDEEGVRWLARLHYDHSPFTFAFGESVDGLRIGDEENQPEVTHREGRAVVFLGSTAGRLFPEEIARYPGYHGVRTDETIRPFNDRVKRWAYVAFPNPGLFSSYKDNHPTMDGICKD